MRRWNWVEGGVLPLATAVLHSGWVWLFVLWAARGVPPARMVPAVSPIVLGLLLLGGAGVTRWALDPDRPLPGARARVAAAGGLAVAAAMLWTHRANGVGAMLRGLVDWGNLISPVFIGLAACGFMWWRGIVLGRAELPQEHLERTFYGGVAALALMYSLNNLRSLVSPSEGLAVALAFFGTGMAALALVSVENARRYQQDATGHWPALNRYWLGTVGGVIGVILLGGLLIGLALSPETFDRLAFIVGRVIDFISIAFFVVMGSFVFLAAWVVTPLLENLSAVIGNNPFVFPPPPPPQELPQVATDLFGAYPMLNVARQALVLVLMVGTALIVFWWAVRRFSRRGHRDVDEQRESIASRDLLLSQLRGLLRRQQRPAPPPAPYLSLTGPPNDPRLLVRRAYQVMLEWAQTRALDRAAGQTPAAYGDRLAEAVPHASEAILALTSVYLVARYAPEPPTASQARQAQAAAARLRSLPPPPGADL